MFDDLTALTGLWLYGNMLTALPAGVFDDLTALTTLNLRNNGLTMLPDGVFARLTALTTLKLAGNSETPFAPVAVALPDDGNGSRRRGHGDARRQRQRWRAVGRECDLFLGADRSAERGDGDV